MSGSLAKFFVFVVCMLGIFIFGLCFEKLCLNLNTLIPCDWSKK